MAANATPAAGQGDSVDIIAFQLGEQLFAVETQLVREIRGWAPCMPVPGSSDSVLGVMNLRGSVIPIVEIARRLGMAGTVVGERSAVIVCEVASMTIGLLVDRVTDMLTVSRDGIQPVPRLAGSDAGSHARGVIPHEAGMACFLDLAAIFGEERSLAA